MQAAGSGRADPRRRLPLLAFVPMPVDLATQREQSARRHRSLAGWALHGQASGCLLASMLLLPGGFLLGGVSIHEGDPGLGGLLVPVGGVLMLAAVGTTALQSGRGS